jgi:hypothetical protein
MDMTSNFHESSLRKPARGFEHNMLCSGNPQAIPRERTRSAQVFALRRPAASETGAVAAASDAARQLRLGA